MVVSELARLVPKSDGRAALEVAGRSVFDLNPVAVIIWEHLAAGVPTAEIVGQLVKRFDITEERATHDVTKFIELLREYFLLSDAAELTT